MVRPEMYRHYFGAIEDVGSLAGVEILMRWLVPEKRPGDSFAVKGRVNQVPSPFQSDPVEAVWQAWECGEDGYGAGQP